MYSFIIPLKISDESRLRCLEKLLDVYSSNFKNGEMILVEEIEKNKESIVYPLSKRYNCTYLPIEPSYEFFCKNKCVNEGYKISKSEYIIVQDGDVIPLIRDFDYELENKEKNGYLCFFNGRRVAYIEDDIVFNYSLEEMIKGYNTISSIGSHALRYTRGFCGGSITIHKTIFESIGGANEEWFGRNGDDNELAFRIKLYCSNNNILYGYLNNSMIHLPHESISWSSENDDKKAEENKRQIKRILFSRKRQRRYFNTVKSKNFLDKQ